MKIMFKRGPSDPELETFLYVPNALWYCLHGDSAVPLRHRPAVASPPRHMFLNTAWWSLPGRLSERPATEPPCLSGRLP